MDERKEFAAKPEMVDDMMSFVIGRLDGFTEEIAYNLRLACEEILVNIASYAYPDRDGRLAIIWDDNKDDQKVKVTFEDEGIPFNPLERDDPSLNVPVKELKIGGLGIMMVRKLMDTVTYEHRDGKNILTVTKGY